LFRYSVTEQGLTLRSDRPLPEDSARRILNNVRQRLDGAPYSQPPAAADICITNSEWRRWLCFLPSLKAVGISYPFFPNVFIRASRIERDRVINAAGNEISPYFTLTHYIAHELGHRQMYRHVGRVRTMVGLPQWIVEGYAEYVGGIPAFDFAQERKDFLAGATSMQPAIPGIPPYRRLYLLMVFLLEKQGWSMERLVAEQPEQQTVENWLRLWPPPSNT
jgi:hypothetical protein